MTSFVDLSVDFAADWADMWEDFLVRLTTVTDAIEAMGAISTSIHALTTGDKTFALIPEARVFALGDTIRAVAIDDGAAVLRGAVTAAAPGSVTVAVTEVAGAGGPFGRWLIMAGGPRGAKGEAGAPGADGTSLAVVHAAALSF